MFRFNSSRLQIKKELGKGRFGKVYPYQKDPEDVKWVVKRIKATDSDELVACLPEIVLGFSCDHPCVIPVKGYYIEKNADGEGYNIYMKLPRMKETLLSDFKERKKNDTPYSEQEIIRHFYSLVCGIGYLHSKKISHGDIKPDNLLLDEEGNAKVADIGIAKHVEEEDSYQTLTGVKGTYGYSAPEIFSKIVTKEILSKADIWSIGAVILELCVFDLRQLNSLSPQDQIQAKLNELFNSIQGKYHDSLFVLIQRLLNLDPKERPDIGDIKTELEKNFSQILDKELLSLGNGNLTQVDKGLEIKAFHQQIKEISEKYEYETKQLKENIGQLEQQLIQQKQQHEDQIKVMSENFKQQINSQVLVGQSREEHPKERLNNIANIDELKQELHQLKAEQVSSEQKNKDLQRYLDTSIKEQMKAYEDQIKALQKSQLEEKTQFDQERKKLLEDLNTLRLKVEDGRDTKEKRESFGEEYERNLRKVISKLYGNWKRLFKIEERDRSLVIFPKNDSLFEGEDMRDSITDEDVGGLSKDLIKTLDENHLFNLFGLSISLLSCKQVTDKALEYVATALSSQPIHLQRLTLNFGFCWNLTDKAFEHVATSLSNQALHLQYLDVDFWNLPGISDVGVEKLAVVIKDSCHTLQALFFNFATNVWCDPNNVTKEKKESLRKRFAHIPKVKIE